MFVWLERDRGLWEKWLIAKTVSPPLECHMSKEHGGVRFGHVASGRGGRVNVKH